MKQSQRRIGGFSLVELMVSITIVGLLASVAVPSFVRYVRRAKTSEALLNLRQLYNASVAYFGSEWVHADGEFVARQFPDSQSLTPSTVPQLTRVITHPSVWEASPTWQQLAFSVSDPHYYAYQYDSGGTLDASEFTAQAYGDLDGDEIISTFMRSGRMNDGNVTGGALVYMNLPLE